MQKLKLRPEKKEKDRQRLVKLARLFDKRIKGNRFDGRGFQKGAF